LSFLEYPCPIANRFECPYRNSTILKDDDLIIVGQMVQTVCDAIPHAHFLLIDVIPGFTAEASLLDSDIDYKIMRIPRIQIKLIPKQREFFS